MKYLCTRTSEWNEQPCDEAVAETYLHRDERTVSDPMDNSYIGASWYMDGKNHRVENNHIVRDIESEGWFVEINSIEELHAFVKKHGGVIINLENPTYNLYSLEIYDDYRE